jgi:thiamine biosynthesis lipoprotein
MEDSRTPKIRTFFVALLAIMSFVGVLLFLHFFSPSLSINSGFRPLMGTLANITVVAEDEATAQQSIEAAFQQLNKVDSLMSYQKQNSQLSEINRSAYNVPVKVDESTFQVLEKGIEFSRRTKGAFDITVAPLVDLWNTAEDTNTLPTPEATEAAMEKVGSDKLILDANEQTVSFTVEDMKIDVGGIAKGYAIDNAIQAIQQAGALGGMVDVGGDIRVFGTPPRNKKYWSIGLQDPKDTSEELLPGSYLLVIKVNNAAVTTSGDYRRYVTVQGQKVSHIIDAGTGQGARDLSSVTIITDTAIKADALATAVTVLGLEKGIDLIESLPDTEAILMSAAPDYKITKSSGADKYID